MSAPDRRAMVERPGKDLSMRRRCALVGVARSAVYPPKPVAGADDLAVMRRIDELHLELPFYGSRRMTFELNKEGRGVNRKRVQRLMRVMGIEALVPRPGTSKASGRAPRIYLLCPRRLVAARRVPGRRGRTSGWWLLIWWRSSTGPAGEILGMAAVEHTNDASFCAAALEEALLRFGKPQISIPIRAPLSPPRLSPASSRRPASRFRWTDAAVSWTTFSSNGCGARSSMKRCI